MTDLIILAMMLPGPKHGYQLKREAGWILGQQALHNNLVYPLLRRFLDEAWVSRKEVPGDRGQTRQQYALTALGRRTLLNRLTEFTEADAASEEAFRFRVALFALLPAEARENILHRRELHLREVDERMAALTRNIGMDKYAGEVVHQMRRHIELEAHWIPRLRRLTKSATTARTRSTLRTS